VCGTDYTFVPYFEYTNPSGLQPKYGDNFDFKTASCDSSNKLNITEQKVTNFKKDSVDIVFKASNNTPYDSVSILEFREALKTDFATTSGQLAIAKNGSGQTIFL
jgi:hypothetical protein